MRIHATDSFSGRRLLVPFLVTALAATVAAVPSPAAAATPRGLDLACPADEVPASAFGDVEGDTHERGIECLSWYQVTQGRTASRYAPGEDVTRGQLATFVAAELRHLGVEVPTNAPDAFPDDNGNVHEASIDAIAELGIVRGFPDGSYRPNVAVRRDQMAAYLAGSVRTADMAVPTGDDAFDDDNGNTHEPSINGVAALGIAAGTSGRSYTPEGQVLRGQMASFLTRLLDLGVEQAKAYEGATHVRLDREEAEPGERLPGSVLSHREVESLDARGCGSDGAVALDEQNGFVLTIPEDQPAGACTVTFTAVSAEADARRITDRDVRQITVGSGSGGGGGGGGGGSVDDGAAISLLSPTTESPASVQERQTFPVTFSTDESGSYVLAHRREGRAEWTAFPNGSDAVAAGEHTVELAAPDQDGAYDLQLTFVTDAGKRSVAEQSRSLLVLEPPGAQPANVAITDPTADSPEITTQGAALSVTFTSDKSGSYSVLYRLSAPGGSATFVPFPDQAARGTMTTPGATTVGLTAPATPGSYDLRVEFTTEEAKQSAATEPGALNVTVPGVTTAQRCDDIDPSQCMFPFPNDHFTAADPTSDTGRRINFNVLSMPRNGADQPGGNPSTGAGKPVEPTEWNRNDGYSPGNHVMTSVPGLDLHQTWGTADEAVDPVGNEGDEAVDPTYFDYRDHIAEPERYLRADAPIVILDATTGERHPFWSELDENRAGPQGQTVGPSKILMLRPRVNFEEGHRYIVALRNLKDSSGQVLQPNATFTGYRDGAGADAGRQLKFEDMFTRLADEGIAREDLYLAWDFTVASERNLSERMLHIRDDAFAQLGDTNLADGIVQGTAPAFEITSWEDGNEDRSPGLGRYRQIDGFVTVPNYLDRPQELYEQLGTLPGTDQLPANPAPPGSRFYYGPAAGPDAALNKDALPQQNPLQPTLQAAFRCRVPLDKGNEVTLGLYGHGLLGTRSQIGDIRSPGHYGFGGCALDWIGMATEDIPTVAAILGDLSRFPALPDRSQQGFLNFLYAGRAMIHPDAFATHEAFQREDGTPFIRTATATETPLFYDGNSQGGILGAGLMAVSVDAKRGILGVPGNNYSTLLNRSVDWEGAYGEAYYAAYQNKAEQQLGFALLQMLWDRSEGNGYAHHTTTDPLPNTIPHDVMLQVAWADHQVSNHAAEVTAMTYGAPVMVPNIEPPPGNHHWEKTPYFTGSATYPYAGSGLVYWDSGNTTPPNGNLPPRQNGDPHGDPRNELAAAWQEAHFLRTGVLADVCNGGPYLTDDHPANNGLASCTPPARAPGGP